MADTTGMPLGPGSGSDSTPYSQADLDAAAAAANSAGYGTGYSAGLAAWQHYPGPVAPGPLWPR